MAQECGFFNAHLVGEDEYDRVYTAEQFAAYFASFIGNGIYGKSMQKLEVAAQESPDMSIKVLSGEAWINGWWYRNSDSSVLSLQIADGVLSRIDAIVLRWGNIERDMWLDVITGVPSVNPVKPPIRRDADYYDLQLATVTVARGAIRITQSSINDTRLDNSVCGLATGVVDQIDTTDLYNQFEVYFKEFKEFYEADYANWTAEQKQAYLEYVDATQSAYDAWTAYKMLEYAQFVLDTEASYNEWTTAQRARFDDWYMMQTQGFINWFEHIKDILSEDAAGKLQLEIEDLQGRVAELEDFYENLANKHMVSVPLYDTRYDVIAGALTNDAGDTITNDEDEPIELTKKTSDPILDMDMGVVKGNIKFAVL